MILEKNNRIILQRKNIGISKKKQFLHILPLKLHRIFLFYVF